MDTFTVIRNFCLYSLFRLLICSKIKCVKNAKINVFICNNFFQKFVNISFLENVVLTREKIVPSKKIYLDSQIILLDHPGT